MSAPSPRADSPGDSVRPAGQDPPQNGGGRVGEAERLRRWRLVLGGGADEGTGVALAGDDAHIDAALAAVYDVAPPRRGGRAGGLGSSAPGVARWLGDIRRYFPTTVVQVMQRDAIDRLQLRRLLLEPEMLAALEPDLDLVTTLLELNRLLPETTRATARQVVARVVGDIERRIGRRTHAAVTGALARSARTRRPRPGDIDWDRTIRANLRHWIPEAHTLVPERLVGYGRRQSALQRDVIIAIDQSGSMADSVVYAGVYGSVLASLRALRTHVVAFDTAVVDLTAHVADPVDVLFGIQLGGGTDIAAAVAYCETLVERPAQTVLVLVTDLYEGGAPGELAVRLADLVRRGVTCLVLLALCDDGEPGHDHDHAAELAEVGVPSFACSPDAFPDVLAAALEGRPLTAPPLVRETL